MISSPPRPRSLRVPLALVALVASVASAPTALAQPAPGPPVTPVRPGAPPEPASPPSASAPASGALSGTVLALDHDDLILDLGATQGATAGTIVEIWRPVRLKHPVTGKILTDRFRIGSLQLTQVRPALTLAHPVGDLARAPEVGDIVLLARSAAPRAPVSNIPGGPELRSPFEERVGPDEPPAALEGEAAEVTAMFDRLAGADLVTRIRAYEDHVRRHSGGRYARVLYEEAAALRALLRRGKKGNAGEVEPVAPRAPRPDLVSFARPDEALAGAPLRLSIELNDAAAGAVLHFRHPGQPAYASLPMEPLGHGYFAATLPAADTRAPRIEYFIAAVSRQGRASAVVASGESPARITIHEVPEEVAPKRLEASALFWTDYADYNRLRGNDRVWQTEGVVGIRRGDTGVRAIRSGFGVYRGVGGSLAELDEQNLAGRRVGLTYGYLEAELGITRGFGLLGRGVVGLLDDGLSTGGQLLVRIGSDKETNLLLGGELIGGVGLRSITQLEWNTFERFPILLRTEVTNQPAGAPPLRDVGEGVARGEAEVGARGIVQIGYRPYPGLLVAVRGSFQGRTIRHAGPGLGGAVGYSW